MNSTFKPNENAQPVIGSANHLNPWRKKIELIFPAPLEVLFFRFIQHHPYEVTCLDIILLENKNPEVARVQ